MDHGVESSAAATRPLLNGQNDGLEVRGSSLTVMLAVSVFVAECGSLSLGCAVGYTSPAESGIMTDLGLNSSQYAVFGSCMIIGSLITSLIGGKTADLVGRKRTMGLSQAFCTLGWLAIIFAENAWWLYIGRLASGLSLGVASFVVPVYVAEITPKNLRGALTACSQLTMCLGTSLMYIAGTVVSWRKLAIIGSVSGLIQFAGLLWIPESPRWLAKVDRDREIIEVLQQLREKDVDVSIEAKDIQEHTSACESFENLPKPTIMILFQRKYANALAVGVGLMVAQQLGGGTAILSYASDIFESAGFSTSIGANGMAIIQILATVFNVSLMDVWGRRPLTMMSLTGMCFSCIVIGTSFLLQDFSLCKDITPVLVFIGLLIYIASYSVAMGAVPFVMMSEIFPMNMKGLAGTFLILVNYTCSLIATFSFLFVLDWSSAGLFCILCAVCSGGLVFVIKLVPETKGRTLEEIQDAMVHFQ